MIHQMLLNAQFFLLWFLAVAAGSTEASSLVLWASAAGCLTQLGRLMLYLED